MNNLKIPNFLIFCIIAFAFISCSQFQLAKEEQQQIKLESKNSLKLMTEEEVIAGFKGLRTQLANKSLFDEKISPEAKERFANLIPENAFFDGKSKLKSQLSFKSTQKAKGSADISEFDSPLESQWNGTCTAHAMRNVLDNKGRTLTSTRHIWSKYRVYSCESAVKALLNKSCVTNNSAWDGGSGLYYCQGVIRNNIIWANSFDQIDMSVTPNYSCIQNWGYSGTGNISDDPLFVSAENSNYNI